MNGATAFLQHLGALLEASGAPGGHDAKRELLTRARGALAALRAEHAGADFTVGEDGVRWGERRLEIEPPAWLERLRSHGVTVLAPPNDEIGFERWVTRLAGQVAGHTRPGDVPPAPGARSSVFDEIDTIESGSTTTPSSPDRPVPVETPGRSVQAQADLVWGIHESAAQSGRVSYAEAASIATTLGEALGEGTLGAESRVIGTLDEYTTAHALNVSLAAMNMASHLAFAKDEVLAIGIAGLLHDIGKVRLGDLPAVSREMLSSEERSLLQTHPAEGARILLDADSELALAAIVAYEHHLPWQGEGGYPVRHFDRGPGRFSRIVSVCDVFDVLTSERTFRPALSRPAAGEYLRLLGGTTLDPDLVSAFLETLERPFPRVWTPLTLPPAEANEIGWLPETGYDADCEPRPVRL